MSHDVCGQLLQFDRFKFFFYSCVCVCVCSVTKEQITIIIQSIKAVKDELRKQYFPVSNAMACPQQSM